MNILEKIVSNKKREVEKLKSEHPLSQHNYNVGPDSNIFFNNLKKSEISIIAEVKRKSPSAGNLCTQFNPVNIAEVYEKSGAEAVSVLTEKKFFGGDKSCLTSIKNNVKIPVLRKDFIVDPYQVYESKYLGADCILLIARVLDKTLLKDCISIAGTIGMFCLVEAHSAEEIEKALNCGAEIIGINNRDLSTFEVNIGKSFLLGRMIPNSVIKISESGIINVSQIKKLYKAGFDGVLIGETLMKSSNPGTLIKEWKQCCRVQSNSITKSYIL